MNRLVDEASPYLRQHAGNPVDWWPWGPDAFAEAVHRDVPVLLSIGYSACHWCHVMAHESFEDPAIAEVMNRSFVNVKVDREERPDVDAIYMEITQATTGHGGWPMTVFLTPQGEPFQCGTYYPKASRGRSPSFAELLLAVDDAWRHQRSELAEQAERLTDYLRRDPALQQSDGRVGAELLAHAERSLLASHDDELGGFGHAPKFPQSLSIDFLLRRAARADAPDSLTAAIVSLDAMAAGGIYDHVGGGFARYSTDDQWLVPHFEKMLYDNALLIRPYLHAWQLTGESRFLQVVSETVGYVRRDLGAPGGAFCSSEDADSPAPDGRPAEGRFTTWTISEVRDALGSDAGAIIDWYRLSETGNFEGRNIPTRPTGLIERTEAIERLRVRLHDERAQRGRPGLDDKVLTEWNALMISSLAEAGLAADRSEWVDAAVRAAEFLCDHLRRDDRRWSRAWQAGSGARHLAYAHDYAALVDAFSRLAEATGHRRWRAEALNTADDLIRLFWDDEHQEFFTTGVDAESLITRPRDVMDSATPSANSTAAVALPRLAAMTGRADLATVANAIVERLSPTAARSPLGFAQLLAALDLGTTGIREVVIPGEHRDLVRAVADSWRPNAVLLWGESDDSQLWQGRESGLAYVCENSVCRLPSRNASELIEQLEQT